ncbi:unnamed protein product [Trichobilharzia regenti]|nr:unnamed protein product [Trichobilharzia regenti]
MLENTSFSLVSIHTALRMLQRGSGDRTRIELNKVLRSFYSKNVEMFFNRLYLASCSKKDSGFEMTVGNRLFTKFRISIQEKFKRVLAEDFRAEIEQAPRKRINQWVKETTKGTIEKLLPFGSVAGDTSILVIATAYLKVDWESVFPGLKSYNSDFHRLDGSKMPVKLMHTESYFEMIDLRQFNSRAVKIPFKDPRGWQNTYFTENEVSSVSEAKVVTITAVVYSGYYSYTLLVILPDANDGLPDLLRSLSKRTSFLFILLSDYFERTKLKLYLPRFKLKGGSNVDEEGAVAAAGTPVLEADALSAVPSESVPVFRVDHPFFLSILWCECIPLFMGYITEPKEN